MTRLYTFGNDLKKRDSAHVLKWEIFQCEDLIENGKMEKKTKFLSNAFKEQNCYIWWFNHAQLFCDSWNFYQTK